MSGNTWNRDQVMVLIEAYREENCLYAISSPNYHNKHLRAEALRRVYAAVSQVRPNTSEKECSNKLHNLRNQFHLENAKVKATLRSGVGTGNVYKPNLWYFQCLKFLEEHYVPRKSITSQLSSSIQKHEEKKSKVLEEAYFIDDDSLCVIVEEGEMTQLSAHVSPTLPSTAVDVSTALPSTAVNATPAASSSTVQHRSTNSHSASTASPRMKKRKMTTGDDAYVGALEMIADSLKQPISIPVANPTTCTVDACMLFLSFVLKQFKSEELKLEIIKELVETVINARFADLNTAKQ